MKVDFFLFVEQMLAFASNTMSREMKITLQISVFSYKMMSIS